MASATPRRTRGPNTRDMQQRYPAVPAREVESFVPFTVAIYHLL